MKPNYRRCVSCRAIAHKDAFWRIVRVYPSRTVQLEEGMGRSAYLCPTADCLMVAQKKKRLGRTLKTSVPVEIYERLWQRLNSPVATTNVEIAPDSANIRGWHHNYAWVYPTHGEVITIELGFENSCALWQSTERLKGGYLYPLWHL